MGSGPGLVTSFYLTYLCRDPTSKLDHIQRNRGLGLQYLNFEGTQFNPPRDNEIVTSCNLLWTSAFRALCWNDL